MRWALAIASSIVLVVHGVVFYSQFSHRWEKHQIAYFDQVQGMAKTLAERAAVEGRKPKIEQTLVTQFGEMRVDRCQTCHIAIDDPRFGNHAQPLRTHPYSEALGDAEIGGRWQRRHRFSDFGCTVCHDGQGRGLDVVYAHGVDHYWPEPLLGFVTQETWRKDLRANLKSRDYMQVSCSQCHTEENFKSTPLVARGRQLYFENACYGCHKIDGISNGTLGPDLTEVGKKWKVDYLWESIVEPKANIATSFMPKFRLSDGDVKALVIFLKSRRGMNFAETGLERYRAGIRGESRSADVVPAVIVTPLPSAARGEQLVQRRACTACHKLDGRDGGIAPDLSYEGLMRDKAWIADHFRDPRAVMADSIMPAFSFPDDEIRDLTAYLTARTTPPPQSTPAELYKALCARCHGDGGRGDGMTAAYLDPAPRDLTKAAFMNSKPATRLVQSMTQGVHGTSMPPWGRVLTPQQINGMLDYVWTEFVKEPRKESKARTVPDRNPMPGTKDSIARGERLFVQRCAGCHGAKADGKGPNSLDITPRPRNLRNAAFMSQVDDRRLFDSILYGVQGTAMPPWIDYGLSTNDVGDLVNFIRSVNVPAEPARRPRSTS